MGRLSVWGQHASAIRWVWRFRATIGRQPDVTLLEIQERLIANCGERFSSSVIWRFFDRHEITLKKDRACRGAAAPGRLEAASGVVWGATRPRSEEARFIDETGASTNLARKGGRCRRGGGCASAFRMAIIRRSPSWPGCAYPASWRRRLSTSR